MKAPRSLLVFALGLAGLSSSPAANVLLKANDAVGTSSFTGATNWSDNAVPSPGNDYFTTNSAGVALQMRTPTGVGNYSFQGDSLTVFNNGGDAFVLKGDTGAIITVTNFFLAGGTIANGGNAGGAATVQTVAGNLTVLSPSRLNASGAGRVINLTASLLGSATLTNAGPGTIVLAGNNSGFTGRTVSFNVTNALNDEIRLGANPPTFVADQWRIVDSTVLITNSFVVDDSNRGVTVTNAIVDVAGGATLTLATPVTGLGATTLVKRNAGTLVLAATNALTGTLFLDRGADGTGLNDGAVRVTSPGALTGVTNISIRNTSVTAGGSRLELDGTSGSITISQPLVWSGRNNATPAFQNLAGNNTMSPPSVTFNAGGGAYPIRSDAGTLTLTGTWPTAASGTRNLWFQGDGEISVPGVIANSGATVIVIKTNAGTLTLAGNNTYSGGTTNAGGTLIMAHPNALGTGPVAFTGTNNATLVVATDGADTPYNVNAGSSTTWTIASGVKTGTLGINHTLGNFSIGSGTPPLQMNIIRATNITGGSPRITLGTLTLSGGVGGTTILNPTTADLTIGSVTSTTSSKTLQLDGTATGNQITGVISDGANVVTLTKSGPGTWTLQGANTYTGNTTISNGTLALSGSGAINGSTNITVHGGATFDVSAASFTLAASQTLSGNGTVAGNFANSSGSRISPGGDAVGRLTFANTLNLAGGGIVRFDFATGTNDTIAAANLSPSGVTTFQLATLPPGGLAAGTYTLFEVAGTLGGSPANFTLTGVPSPSRQTFTVVYDTVSSPKRVQLQVTGAAAVVTWRGNLGPLWDIATTLNWTNLLAGTPDFYYDGDTAFFTDLGVATSPVLNTTVQPGATTFNAAGDYTLTGTGKISGSGTLTKAGSGTVTISTANDYTGVTTLNGGTVSVATVANGGAASPLGAASSSPDNLVFNGGKLQYTGATATSDRGARLSSGGGTVEVASAATTLTVSGSLTGTNGGALTKQGPGTLVLAGANTYDGATTVSAGTLQVGAGGGTGALGAGPVLNHGALVVDRTGTLVLSNNLAGTGTLTKNAAGTLALAGTNSYTGVTTINAGILQLLDAEALGGTPAAYNAAQILLAGGELLAGVSANLSDTNSGLTVAAATIGVDAGATFTISNTVTVTTSLTKSRPGTLVLAGNNSIAGTLFVDTASATGSDGILRVTSDAALGGVGDIQIRNNQVPGASTLQLDGTAGPITLNQNFTWAGRNNYVPAIESLAGNNVFHPATFTMLVGGSNYPISAVAGTLTLPGTYPTASPTAGRSFVFGGAGTIFVPGTISAASSTAMGVIKTNTGTLALTGFHTYNGNSSFQEGTVLLTNVTLGVSTANIELAPYAGNTVTVNATNAFLTAQRVILAGHTANNTAPGTAILNQFGGSIDSYQWFTVGSGGTTGGTGIYHLIDGTLTVRSQQMEVGNFTGASGLVTMNGPSASLNIWNNNYLTLGANANAGPGTFIQNNGNVTLYADAGSTPGGTGFLMLGRAAGLTNTYTYRLNGGTLTVPAISSISGTSLLYLNGGTLRAARSNATFVAGLTAAYLSTNGVTLDDNGFSVTLPQGLVKDPALGAAPDAGVTKQGWGSVTLAGTNTYTGPTVVNGGALNINGRTAGGSVTVNGGSLGGAGVIGGAVAIQSGTSIAPGAPFGTLTISNNLALAGGATALFNFGPGTNSQLHVSGAVTVSGPVSVNLAFLSAVPAVGQHTLLRYGSLTGFGNLSVGTLNPRYSFSLTNDTAAKEVRLVISGIPAALTWVGDGTFNAWDNLGGYQNWNNGGSPDYFYDGDLVTFNNSGSTTPAVNLQNVVSPGSLTVNASVNYEFGGIGSLAGPGGLTKSGTGTLTLTTDNTYTGPTVINAGTVQVGNDTSTGSLGTGAITNHGTLAFKRNNDLTVASPIAGSGAIASLGSAGTVTLAGEVAGSAVTHTGTGALSLNASNSHTGLTLVTAGILFPRHPNALGSTNVGTIVTNAGQLYIDQNHAFTNEALVLGGAALRKGGGGVTDWTGPVTLAADTTLHVDGGATLNLAHPGGIVGASFTLTLAGDGGGNGTIAGPLQLGAGALIKNGAGAWTLAPTNLYTGTSTLNAGLLRLTGNESLGQAPPSPNLAHISLNGGELLAATNVTFTGANRGVTVATATIGVEAGSTFTLAGPLTVNGALTKSRAGTLVLSGTNGIWGTLNIDTLSNTANDGATRVTHADALLGAAVINIRNQNGGSSTLQLDGTGGGFTVTANLALNCRNNDVPAVVNLAGTNTLAGNVTLGTGGNRAIYQCDAGLLVFSGNNTYDGSLVGSRTNVFTGAGNHRVTGQLQAPLQPSFVSLAKSGTGTLTLENAHTYNDRTVVAGGTLMLLGSITSTGGVFVAGGTLAGTGTINDTVTVQPGGTLAPGTSIGDLTINGNLVLGGTTAIEVNKAAATRDRVLGVNALTYGGTLHVVNLAGTPVVGDSFQIFTPTSFTGNFSAITGSPGPGLAWAFNPTNGTVSVVTGVAGYPTNITATVSGSSLNITWPGTHLGWILQSQTNSRSVGLNTNWFDVPGTASVTNFSATINPTNPTVFFRLRKP
jgi:autotransporter-associated beta strand protein